MVGFFFVRAVKSVECGNTHLATRMGPCFESCLYGVVAAGQKSEVKTMGSKYGPLVLVLTCFFAISGIWDHDTDDTGINIGTYSRATWRPMGLGN